MGKKSVVVSALLLAGIGVLSYLNFYRRTVMVDTTYGAAAGRLQRLFGKGQVGSSDQSCIFLFGEFPNLTEIDMLEKLQRKYGDTVAFMTIFSKRFRSREKLLFPHRFKDNTRFRNRVHPDWESWYALLKNGKIIYSSGRMQQEEILLILEKNTNEQYAYTDLAVDAERQKIDITLKLRKGGLALWNVAESKPEVFDTHAGMGPVKVILGACTACQLQRVVEEIGRSETENLSERPVYIFSFLSNRNELQESQLKKKIKSVFYYDWNDELGNALGHLQTKDRIIEIDRSLL